MGHKSANYYNDYCNVSCPPTAQTSHYKVHMQALEILCTRQTYTGQAMRTIPDIQGPSSV